MSLVDSADSVLMLYSYAGFPDRRFSLFEKTVVTGQETAATPSIGKDPETAKEKLSIEKEQAADSAPVAELPENKVQTQAKMNVMSGLSIVLTLMSILVALSISLITIMSLIGEECVPCSEAAESDDGLAGRWWRGWAHVRSFVPFLRNNFLFSLLRLESNPGTSVLRLWASSCQL